MKWRGQRHLQVNGERDGANWPSARRHGALLPVSFPILALSLSAGTNLILHAFAFP